MTPYSRPAEVSNARTRGRYAGAVEPRPPRPRVLVVDATPNQRLRVVAALSSTFEPLPLADGEDPLRTARAKHPDLVLFALDRADVDQVLRFCRTLRTDIRPVGRVAVYTRGQPPRPIETILETWRADGVLAGAVDEIASFSEAVLRGERPVRVVEGGPLGRLIGRLRSGRA